MAKIRPFLLWCYGIDFAPIKWYHQFHSSWLYVKILPLWSLLTLYSNVSPYFCLSAIFLSFCLFDLLLIYLSQEALFLLLLVCLSLRTTVYFDYTDFNFLNLKSQTKLTSEGKKTVCISSKHLSIFFFGLSSELSDCPFVCMFFFIIFPSVCL